jgi:hypothetical protein
VASKIVGEWNMPIDPSILLLQRVAEPPAIIEVIHAADLRSEFFSTVLPALADQMETDVDHRISRLRENIQQLWLLRQEGREKDDTIFVEFLEGVFGRVLADMSRRLTHMENRFAREQKKNPRLAKLKPYYNRIIAAARREIEEKIDMSLVARAIRADRSKAARGGRTFDDPQELAKYLRRELA